MSDIVDLTAAIEQPEEIPCCPLCDQPIESHDPRAEFVAYGCVALAHIYCIAEAREEWGL